MNFLTQLRDRLASQEGATATEYVFLLVLIALLITVGALALGNAINDGMNSAATGVCGTANVTCTTGTGGN